VRSNPIHRNYPNIFYPACPERIKMVSKWLEYATVNHRIHPTGGFHPQSQPAPARTVSQPFRICVHLRSSAVEPLFQVDSSPSIPLTNIPLTQSESLPISARASLTCFDFTPLKRLRILTLFSSEAGLVKCEAGQSQYNVRPHPGPSPPRLCLTHILASVFCYDTAATWPSDR